MVVDVSELGLDTELAQNVDALLRVGPADLEVVMKHYDVTTEMLVEMIRSIRDWYGKQAHLPQGQLHNRQIVGHLMIRGFSMENVKRNIDNFYTARRRMPELMCDRDPGDDAWRWYMQRFWYVLPQKTAENHRITIYRMNKDLTDLDVTLVMKLAFLLCEYRIWNDASLGDCWIFDYKNATLQQAIQMTPMLISKINYFWKSCFGSKMISVHLLNLPPFGATILNLFKIGLKSKIIDRIHISKTEDLLGIFPKEVLPKEYGGTELSCQDIADEWLKMFMTKSWRKYLVEQDSICSDESKRLIPNKADEIFGVDGSFKKLCLD